MARRYVLMILVGAGLAMLAWQSRGAMMPGEQIEGGGKGAGENDKRLVVDSRESPLWLAHLREGGSVRFEAPKGTFEVEKHAKDYGEFSELEKQQMAEGLATRVTVFTRKLEGVLREESWSSVELQELRYAEASLEARQYEEYERSWRSGQYVVLGDRDTVPEMGSNISWLMIGSSCAGRSVRVLLLADKQSTPLGEMEKHLATKRKVWLQRVCSDFNGLPDEERAARIGRLVARKNEDRDWIKSNFPDGVVVDNDSHLMYLDNK